MNIKTKMLTLAAVAMMITTLHAGIDRDSLLGKPDYFFWPGSVDEVISIIEGDATRVNPPYHQRSRSRWEKDYREVVSERADRAVVFRLSSKNTKHFDCETTCVFVDAYTPADYEIVLHGDPHGPARPEIP
jgi:hypothetical protein